MSIAPFGARPINPGQGPSERVGICPVYDERGLLAALTDVLAGKQRHAIAIAAPILLKQPIDLRTAFNGVICFTSLGDAFLGMVDDDAEGSVFLVQYPTYTLRLDRLVVGRYSHGANDDRRVATVVQATEDASIDLPVVEIVECDLACVEVYNASAYLSTPAQTVNIRGNRVRGTGAVSLFDGKGRALLVGNECWSTSGMDVYIIEGDHSVISSNIGIDDVEVEDSLRCSIAANTCETGTGSVVTSGASDYNSVVGNTGVSVTLAGANDAQAANTA